MRTKTSTVSRGEQEVVKNGTYRLFETLDAERLQCVLNYGVVPTKRVGETEGNRP